MSTDRQKGLNGEKRRMQSFGRSDIVVDRYCEICGELLSLEEIDEMGGDTCYSCVEALDIDFYATMKHPDELRSERGII